MRDTLVAWSTVLWATVGALAATPGLAPAQRAHTIELAGTAMFRRLPAFDSLTVRGAALLGVQATYAVGTNVVVTGGAATLVGERPTAGSVTNTRPERPKVRLDVYDVSIVRVLPVTVGRVRTAARLGVAASLDDYSGVRAPGVARDALNARLVGGFALIVPGSDAGARRTRRSWPTRLLPRQVRADASLPVYEWQRAGYGADGWAVGRRAALAVHVAWRIRGR